METIVICIIVAVVACVIGFLISKVMTSNNANNVVAQADKKVAEAER